MDGARRGVRVGDRVRHLAASGLSDGSGDRVPGVEIRLRTQSPDVVRDLVPYAQRYRREGEDYSGAEDRFVSESGFRKRRTPTPQQLDALEEVYGKRFYIIRRSKNRTLYLDRGVHGSPAYKRDMRGKFRKLDKKDQKAVERARKRKIKESNFVDYSVKSRSPARNKKKAER